MKKPLIALLVALVGASSLSAADSPAPSPYKIAHRFSVPGDGGWDYLTFDEPMARLFISHGTVVQEIGRAHV